MGGFGITYLAADNYLQLKVAIKEFFPSSVAVRNQYSGSVALRSDQVQAEYLWAKERFIREAQTLARFHHKNIVQVFRYFEGNGTCYMVMAYEEGLSLEQILADNSNQWTEQSVLDLVMPLLDGLEAIHKAGFLHRDIKPGNIVLRSNGEGPVLIDFGAARSPTSSEALTVVLSHGYGPPEQYSRQGNQGPWTDIYSMAGVLYRIVTHVVPAVSLQRIKHDVMIPAAFSGEGRFSEAFLRAIDQALNVDETKRPQNIGEWRQLLTRGISRESAAPATKADFATTQRQAGDSSTDRAGMNPASTSGNGHRSATSSIHRNRSTSEDSPSNGRSGMHGLDKTGRTWQFEKSHEPSLLGRLWKTMHAHPMLALLLILALAYFAASVSRPSSSPALPKQAPPPVDATAAKIDAPKAEPAVRSQGGPDPVTTLPQPAPSDAQLPRDSEDILNDGERRRSLPPEVFAACEGKSTGARCSFIDRRNASLNGFCVIPPSGIQLASGEALACRPARGNDRLPRPAGTPRPEFR